MRPTIDERMDRWLNEQADKAEIGDEDRQRYIDILRKTTAAASARFGFAFDDLGEALGIARFWRWLLRLEQPGGRE